MAAPARATALTLWWPVAIVSARGAPGASDITGKACVYSMVCGNVTLHRDVGRSRDMCANNRFGSSLDTTAPPSAPSLCPESCRVFKVLHSASFDPTFRQRARCVARARSLAHASPRTTLHTISSQGHRLTRWSSGNITMDTGESSSEVYQNRAGHDACFLNTLSSELYQNRAIGHDACFLNTLDDSCFLAAYRRLPYRDVSGYVNLRLCLRSLEQFDYRRDSLLVYSTLLKHVALLTIQAASLVCQTRSAVLWFQSAHLAQGLPPGGIIYQSQWCFQNVLRLWELFAAAKHDMSQYALLYLTLPVPGINGCPSSMSYHHCSGAPSRYVRAGHWYCGSMGCCAVGGPEPATFSMRMGNRYVATECKPLFRFHVALATRDGYIFDLDQGDALWGSHFEEWIQHIAWIEHPGGDVEQVVGRAQFRFLEHPMHRRNPANDGEYIWAAEIPVIPGFPSATHGCQHGFPEAITFATAPVIMNVVAGAAAQARIDAASVGCPMRGDAYTLDRHLAISGVFSAWQFRAELAAATGCHVRCAG